MKTKRIVVMLLAVVMLLGVLASCGGSTKTTVKITFMDADGNIVIDPFTAELKMADPTVLDAVKAVKDAYATAEEFGQITLTADESAVKDVDNCKENLTEDADGYIYYWMFLINGEEPSGDAGDVVVKEGDNIVYQYVKTVVEA